MPAIQRRWLSFDAAEAIGCGACGAAELDGTNAALGTAKASLKPELRGGSRNSPANQNAPPTTAATKHNVNHFQTTAFIYRLSVTNLASTEVKA